MQNKIKCPKCKHEFTLVIEAKLVSPEIPFDESDPPFDPDPDPFEGKSDHDRFRVPFGKHKGEHIGDVPSSYLSWILQQDWLEDRYPDFAEIALAEFDTRKRSKML